MPYCANCGAVVVENSKFCGGCGKAVSSPVGDVVLVSAPASAPKTLRSPERWTVSILLLIALLTFFFPLLTIQMPLRQDVTGYDIYSETRQLEKQVSSISKQNEKPSTGPQEPQEPSVPSSPSERSEPPIPLSLRLAPMIPLEVTLAFVCALVALLGTGRGIAVSKVVSTLGAASAVVATIHLLILNSDMHSWIQQSMQASTEELRDNPFAGFAQQLGNLMVNSFQVKPGVGMYVLTLALVVVAVAYHSRFLARLRLSDSAGVKR